MSHMLPWVIRREVHAIYAQRGMPILRAQWEMVQPDEVLAAAVADPLAGASDRTKATWRAKLGTDAPEVGLVVLHRDYMEGHTTMLVWPKKTTEGDENAQAHRVQGEAPATPAGK